MMTSGILPARGNVSRAFGPNFTRDLVGGDAPSRSEADRDLPVDAEDDLAKLVRLISSNDRLFAEMASLRARIDEAKSYLSGPGCRARLGAAYLDRLELRRSAALACLRANRIEARSLLASLNP